MKILMVLTSQSEPGNTGKKTDFWMEEFAALDYILKDSRATITIASPKEGQPPIDPTSSVKANQTEATYRFDKDAALKELLAHTKIISEVSTNDFDAVLYSGGHSPLWDLTNDKDSIELIEKFWSDKKPVAAVCHKPSVLLHLMDEENLPLLKDNKITGFTNTEEEAVGPTKIVPFLMEDELKSKGVYILKKKTGLHM